MTTNERGFTLVEVIVAMLVCVVGLIGMAQMLAVTLRMQQLGRNSATAVRMAQDKIDELSSMNFADAVLSPSVQCGGSLTANLANYNDVPTVGGQAQPYRRRWLIQAGPDADPQLRQVTVRLIPDNVNRTTNTQYDLVSIIRGAGVAVCP
jgi:prepilin-type N-terminal cleavage/methylation domain-containing protein